MTAFLLIAGLMVLVGIAVLGWPLLRRRIPAAGSLSDAPRAPSVVFTALFVIAIVVGLYPFASNWHWKDAERSASSRAESGDPMIERLEDRLRGSPDELDGWIMLGRAYAARHRNYRAADAYERALELSDGNNTEAMLGLGEALALADQHSLTGRAGQLLERVATLEPQNARALWWGGAAAYQRNDFALARDRWQQFLATNPPPDIAQILRVKIAEIDQQLGSTQIASNNQPAAANQVRVRVDVAGDINGREGALFVLARHPGEAGPPLAVKRLPLGKWPIDVVLGADDAMMPGRSLSAGDEVQVVARISRSGTASPASGDGYGEVRYHVGRDGVVALRIDKRVP